MISRRAVVGAVASLPLLDIRAANAIPTLPAQFIDIKLKVQSTSRVVLPMIMNFRSTYDQVIKTSRLEFAPGAGLVFENLDYDWVAIYADVIALNGPASIARTSKIVIDGDDGVPGKNGLPTRPGPGVSGNPGFPGGPGYEGGTQAVPDVFLFCKQFLYEGRQADPSEIKNQFSFRFDGYQGGKGGDGGAGGNGTPGNKGRKARDGWLDCNAGPGWGGAGGDAGAGGAPGIGGNGSDGPAIYFFVHPSQINIAQAISYSVKGGRRGQNGRPGANGRPGRGGDEGDATGHCSPAGRRGRDGSIPRPCGLPDITGKDGLDGPPPTSTDYTGFAELD